MKIERHQSKYSKGMFQWKTIANEIFITILWQNIRKNQKWRNDWLNHDMIQWQLNSWMEIAFYLSNDADNLFLENSGNTWPLTYTPGNTLLWHITQIVMLLFSGLKHLLLPLPRVLVAESLTNPTMKVI